MKNNVTDAAFFSCKYLTCSYALSGGSPPGVLPTFKVAPLGSFLEALLDSFISFWTGPFPSKLSSLLLLFEICFHRQVLIDLALKYFPREYSRNVMQHAILPEL